jgi:SAM-dependent methyltransferase
MHARVERFFRDDVPELTSRLNELEMKVEPLAYPEDEDHLRALENIMCQMLAGCRELDVSLGDDADSRTAAQARFREATAPWLNQSWIINRARTKPRGFPGDYQMLLAIYDGVPIARGLGGYLDRLCLKMTLGEAVQARLQDAKTFLSRELEHRDGEVRVLDIASGPGREFQGGFAANLGCAVHVTCVDSDAGALEYVRRHVSTKSAPKLSFSFLQHNALKMRSADAIIKQFGRQDIIYSVGLADYIPDRLLVPMLASWKEALHPGGCVYVAFKDKNQYDKVEYQWLMDWHFLQRDERDFIRLLGQAGYEVQSLQTSRDATGVIVNYLAYAKVPSFRRLDHIPQRTQLAPAKQQSATSGVPKAL